MISDFLIFIPTNSATNTYCNYLEETSIELAKRNKVLILYMNEYVKWWKGSLFKDLVRENKKVFHCHLIQILPGNRFKHIEEINQKLNLLLLKIYLFLFKRRTKTLLWLFYPELGFLTQYLPQSESIYDCIDFYTPDSISSQAFAKQVKFLLNHATLVTSISESLKKRVQKQTLKDIHIVPQGFSTNTFQNISQKKTIEQWKKSSPTIGFVGGINERLDYKLLYSLIKKNPQWQFVFAGPKGHEPNILKNKNMELFPQIESLPNFLLLPPRQKSMIGSLIQQFDIAIIPYDVSYNFNKYCYPMKLFEYFYLEKPVLSTPIQELKRFSSLVKIGNSAEEWEQNIKEILSKPEPAIVKKRKKELALENSWERKIEAISTLLLEI